MAIALSHSKLLHDNVSVDKNNGIDIILSKCGNTNHCLLAQHFIVPMKIQCGQNENNVFTETKQFKSYIIILVHVLCFW